MKRGKSYQTAPAFLYLFRLQIYMKFVLNPKNENNTILNGIRITMLSVLIDT